MMTGLHFIGRNVSVVMDEQMVAPIGFNIIFPGMLSSAVEMGLEIPIRPTDIDRILHLQEMELKRFGKLRFVLAFFIWVNLFNVFTIVCELQNTVANEIDRIISS